jgi:hypothetical protein
MHPILSASNLRRGRCALRRGEILRMQLRPDEEGGTQVGLLELRGLEDDEGVEGEDIVADCMEGRLLRLRESRLGSWMCAISLRMAGYSLSAAWGQVYRSAVPQWASVRLPYSPSSSRSSRTVWSLLILRVQMCQNRVLPSWAVTAGGRGSSC